MVEGERKSMPWGMGGLQDQLLGLFQALYEGGWGHWGADDVKVVMNYVRICLGILDSYALYSRDEREESSSISLDWATTLGKGRNPKVKCF